MGRGGHCMVPCGIFDDPAMVAECQQDGEPPCPPPPSPRPGGGAAAVQAGAARRGPGERVEEEAVPAVRRADDARRGG